MTPQNINDYKLFLESFDKKLDLYRSRHAKHQCCKKGCSACCLQGDYPLSELELRYLMMGYSGLENEKKLQVQDNLKEFKKGGKCPFLLNDLCSVYSYRPIICRVHGLAYLSKDKVIVPYCVNSGLNYKEVYSNSEFLTEPIKENLDTHIVLKDFDYGLILPLYNWVNK